MKRFYCNAWILMFALVSVGVAQQPLTEGAYFATTYNQIKYGASSGRVGVVPFGTPVILVTMKHYVRIADIQSGKLFELRDKTTGAEPLGTEVVEIRALHNATSLCGGFILGGQFREDREYEIRMLYGSIVWDWDSDNRQMVQGVGSKGTVPVQRLAGGSRITNYGRVTPDTTKQAQFGAVSKSSNQVFARLLDHGKLTLTPETSEHSRELGLKYAFEYSIDQERFGTSIPSRFSLDIDIDGRETSDRNDPGFMGYSKGDLNLRLMALPGSERYYPLGVRAAVGYESDENFRTIARTATAQVVLTVPYIDDLLLGWHRAFGVNRAFAPPVVSAGVVYSGGTAGSLSTGDRWEFEVAWIAPVAEKWDFNIRWRYYDFFSSSMKNQEFMEIGLTYFTSKDRSQGMTLSIEDGFRPLVGDLGSTVLLGYMVRGF